MGRRKSDEKFKVAGFMEPFCLNVESLIFQGKIRLTFGSMTLFPSNYE